MLAGATMCDVRFASAISVRLRTQPSEIGLAQFQKAETARFESTQVPFVATFWRTTIQTVLRHGSPLLLIPGVGVHCFAIDLLHTWHLGPLIRLIALVFMRLLTVAAFLDHLSGKNLYVEDKLHLGIQRLRSELWEYYYRQRRDPSWRHKGSEV